jgi:hypothetical protein
MERIAMRLLLLRRLSGQLFVPGTGYVLQLSMDKSTASSNRNFTVRFFSAIFLSRLHRLPIKCRATGRA